MLRGAHRCINLITVLAQKGIKVEYKSSFLGFLWSVGHTLTFAFVFFIVFKVAMKIQMEHYVFLIAGLWLVVALLSHRTILPKGDSPSVAFHLELKL
jgi:ABC-type polysaccharide/polyol phosphate export permease